MHLKTWTQKDISLGTRVFLRIDGNVPVKNMIAEDGDQGRLAKTIPEIVRLSAHRARVIIATHLGDPKGKRDEKFSVIPIARALQRRIGRPIHMIPDLSGPHVERVIMDMEPGQVAMIDNLRFDPGEEANDDEFARKLARLADVYVNNAFGVCHRAHASVVGIPKYLPSFAGSLVREEVTQLSKEPSHPFVLIMGGAKLSTKLPILERLGAQADKILLGGAIALPFLKGLDRPMPVEPKDHVGEDDVLAAQSVLRRYMEKIVLPEDLIIEDGGDRVLDIGPNTVELFSEALRGASTVLWNGPLGIIEEKDGRKATETIAKTLAEQKIARAILGGGESVEFLESRDLLYGFTHVSTGGGAMLAFLSGEKLPGLEVLKVV